MSDFGALVPCRAGGYTCARNQHLKDEQLSLYGWSPCTHTLLKSLDIYGVDVKFTFSSINPWVMDNSVVEAHHHTLLPLIYRSGFSRDDLYWTQMPCFYTGCHLLLCYRPHAAQRTNGA